MLMRNEKDELEGQSRRIDKLLGTFFEGVNVRLTDCPRRRHS